MPNDRAGYLTHVGLGHILTAYYVSGVPKTLLAPFWDVIHGLAKESDADMAKVWDATIKSVLETITMTNSVLGMIADKPPVDLEKARQEMEIFRTDPDKFKDGFIGELMGMVKQLMESKVGTTQQKASPKPDNALGLNLEFRKEDIRW